MGQRARRLVGMVVATLVLLAACGGGSGPKLPIATGRDLGTTYTPYSVSCTSPTFCLAVVSYLDEEDAKDTHNGALYTIRWDGRGWGDLTQALPPSAHAGTHKVQPAVGCSSPTHCVVLGADGTTSHFVDATWDGSAWKAGTGFTDNGALAINLDLTCPGANLCVAYDGQSTWDQRNGVWTKGATRADTVACASAAYCLGVNTTTDIWDGSSWTPGTAAPTIDPFVMACARRSFCVLGGSKSGSSGVDTIREAASWDGSRWSKPSSIVPKKGGNLDQMSCPPGGSTCFGMDEQADLFTYQAGHWKRQPTRLGAAVEDVSCPSVGFCAVADEIGGLLTIHP